MEYTIEQAVTGWNYSVYSAYSGSNSSIVVYTSVIYLPTAAWVTACMFIVALGGIVSEAAAIAFLAQLFTVYVHHWS